MRIILADHHPLPCWALRTMLMEEPEIDLIGEAGDAQGLIRLAEEEAPDLVLMDKDLPGDTIQNLIARLHALKPKPVVIVMSSEMTSSTMILKVGADAFVSKVDDPAWLVEKLRTCAKTISKEVDNRNKSL